VNEGERVLDMGTGSGVNAILAATKGAQVLAVDINPRAVEAARANAQGNGVAHKVEYERATCSPRSKGASTSSCSIRHFGGFVPVASSRRR